MRDEEYIIDLCDEVLGQKSERRKTFDFLRGDGSPGRRLPVDAFYPRLNLVVEYRERQHSESVEFWDERSTTSGMSRGQQRARYDQRRRDVFPKHGIALVELNFSDFEHFANGRLRRIPELDKEVLAKRLSDWVGTAGVGGQ